MDIGKDQTDRAGLATIQRLGEIVRPKSDLFRILDDPLGRFLASIRGFERLPETSLVLPSHGNPFRNIGLRVAQLIEHHDARCAELLAACAEPRSAGELLSTLFPRQLDTHQVMFAMGEAIAHLNHLEHKGDVRKVEGIDGIVRFVKSN